jgi:hypothetical protein
VRRAFHEAALVSRAVASVPLRRWRWDGHEVSYRQNRGVRPRDSASRTDYAAGCFGRQQQTSLFHPRMSSNTPIIVRAMGAQPTCHQASMITRIGRMTLQKQKLI